MAETVIDIVAAHRAGTTTPAETIARTYARIRAHDDPAIFIALRDEAEAIAEAKALTDKSLPLYGVPVAVKDNIDVAGLPTTAACPAFSFNPTHDSTAVARLRRAGAIIVGKTNLDQFATGLVGVRSPYGVPRNTFDSALVPGGSSSGSAVAVAAGLVPLSLGTDTAGSGRVPAGFNNIVGLKPSLGLISTHGLVPACRTLDCISVFALTVDDAWAGLSVVAGPDAADSYSRNRPLGTPGAMPPKLKLGVPLPGQRLFFGDKDYEAGYEAALARLAKLGCEIVAIDIEPFYETARLLYEGPWVAERALVAQKLLASDPDAIHPVTRSITLDGLRPTAMDAFAAFYKLERLRRVSDYVFAHQVDALLLPTAPTTYTVKQVLADPVQLNSRLGTYTNFVNLLDLCGLAVPASLTGKGLPFGITLLAPGGQDARLAEIGRIFHADTQLPMGALKLPQPPLNVVPAATEDEIAVAVVGAHLSGLPLNGDLRSLGGRLLEATRTAPDYKFYALNGAVPPKPGLLRVGASKGSAVDVEVWALPKTSFGAFIDTVGAPLSIGTVTLADGRGVKGFLMEAAAAADAKDISSAGGWRAYLAEAKL